MTQIKKPERIEELIAKSATKETRYIALDVSAETFSFPCASRDGAIENLYERMGYDGTNAYNGTIIIIEATGPMLFVLGLYRLTFHAGYMRLQSYRPDPAARRRDAQAADIDESQRLH